MSASTPAPEGAATPHPAAASAALLPADLFLPVRTGFARVLVADILFASAEGHYCQLMLRHTRHTVHRPLRELLAQLAPYGFVQVHRSHLLHPGQVSHLSKTGHEVTVGGHCLPVGDSFRERLLACLPLGR